MRLTKPNWDIPVQINQVGIGIISLFTSDLFEFLDSNLANLLGDDWATTLPRDVAENPPDFSKAAVDLVIRQAESLTEEWLQEEFQS